MGHLEILSTPHQTIPKYISKFVFTVIQNKILVVTDNSNLKCRFYILKSGLSDKHTYYVNGDSIEINYSNLDKFDPKKMCLAKSF